MAAVAGWSWWERIRRRHFLHSWYMRLSDGALECTRCGAVKSDS